MDAAVQVRDYFPHDMFRGKTVFVTGGGSGINLGVARNFATLGAHIAICGRTQEKLDTAAVELRG
jgi:short-subunit dehydrogenase involved in D-alanine esterification of teichoic acids